MMRGRDGEAQDPVVLDLPLPSTDSIRAVVGLHSAGNYEMRVQFFADEVDQELTVRFIGVRALRWMAEGLCTINEVGGRILQVVEVQDSDWRRELVVQKKRANGLAEYRHFAVFINDDGATEVIARGVQLA